MVYLFLPLGGVYLSILYFHRGPLVVQVLGGLRSRKYEVFNGAINWACDGTPCQGVDGGRGDARMRILAIVVVEGG